MVIGTPGRVGDMIRRNMLKLDNLLHFILDDADEMLSFGFNDQVYNVFTSTCLSWFRFASSRLPTTMPLYVLEMTERRSTNPGPCEEGELTLEASKSSKILRDLLTSPL